MFATRVFYQGRVHGVGFRYTAKSIASEFDVYGWVRNLEDGRVELLAIASEEEELDAFLDEIAASRLAHHIKDVEIRSIDAPSGIRGFSILK